MDILLVGAGSQVGRALLPLLKSHSVSVEVLEVPKALSAAVAQLAAHYQGRKFTCIVNVDHVDGLYTEGLSQKELEERHVFLPQQLAKLAEELDTAILQLSDYHVFSGNSDKPWREEDEPHSQTLYGVSRWQGELSAQRFAHRCIVLRIGTLFCEEGRNVLTTLLDQWQQGKARELSTQLQFSPTPVSDVVRVIFAILQQVACEAPVWGVYHYCSADVATPYDFAEVLLAARTQYVSVENEIRIKPVNSALPRQGHKSRAAPTALNTVLVCEKILNTFGIRQRPWRGELTRMIERMEKPHEQG